MVKLIYLVAFAGFSAMPLVAHAQNYPTRSITVVVRCRSRASTRAFFAVVFDHSLRVTALSVMRNG
jgi:hypothetical protein